MSHTLGIFIQNLVMMHCFLGLVNGRKNVALSKEETRTTTLSPPEGNTTFIGGTTWCVARPGASAVDLKIALDWACGLGGSNCGYIQAGGPCFEPDTLVSHASFAFNNYYQQNGNSDIACHFGGTAVITPYNPSYARCNFASSGPIKNSSSFSYEDEAKSIWRKILVVLLLYLSWRSSISCM